ncbi:BA14K family protein [Hoeflea sp. 108]|uniref:BA14K family protein n=1 Tax=Hoeflea sp. 108 TaxID=1116369 RepID=UPI00037851BA|nr:BA14K family protein [Hoeflea sp. 108]
MNRIFKTLVLSAAVAATTLAALPAAEAGERWRRYDHGRRDNTGAIVAAGALGLIAGAVIAGSANRQQPVYDDYYDDYQPQPRRVYRQDYYGQDYYRPAPVQRRVVYRDSYAVEPWTPEWYSYCSDRYRSFKPRSGTFTGYDGQEHFCTAN